jgi:hypothetical protein
MNGGWSVAELNISFGKVSAKAAHVIQRFEGNHAFWTNHFQTWKANEQSLYKRTAFKPFSS